MREREWDSTSLRSDGGGHTYHTELTNLDPYKSEHSWRLRESVRERVSERERERARQRKKERERERARGRGSEREREQERERERERGVCAV